MTPLPVTVRRIDLPPEFPEGSTVVADALVPMVWWPDVPVRRNVRVPLSGLDQFVLEAALTLGTVTEQDFTELTALPEQVLHAVAATLVPAGALSRAHDGYVAVPEVANPAVRQRAIVRQRPSTAGFALLPRHGDLLGLPPGGGWPADLRRRRLRPATLAPAPKTLWNTGRDRFLAERLNAGPVPGLDPSFVALAPGTDDPPLLPSTDDHRFGVCPAYRCRATIHGRPGQRPTVNAVFHGATADPDLPTAEVEADLTGADGLVREWMSLADAVAEPVVLRDLWRQVCPPGLEDQPPTEVRRRAPAQWEIPVNGITAAALTARGEDLSRPVGIAVEGDAAIVHVACWFVRDDTTRRARPAEDAPHGADDRTVPAADDYRDIFGDGVHGHGGAGGETRIL